MGLEANCLVKLNGVQSSGKAHCGDGEIDFRGDFKFRWRWSELGQIESTNEILTLSKGYEQAEFHLGEAAHKWRNCILNPKSRLDKLGLKPNHRYQAIGEFDEEFEAELLARAGSPDVDQLDAIFIRLDGRDGLYRLEEAKLKIVSNGMIWAVWPKGRKEFREDDIRNFAIQNGLVDVKVASFSEKLSALKLVIPVALRS